MGVHGAERQLLALLHMGTLNNVLAQAGTVGDQILLLFPVLAGHNGVAALLDLLKMNHTVDL